MSGFEISLLRPLWLLALPLVALIAWWLSQRRGGVGDWEKVADPALLSAMAALGRIDTNARRLPLGAALAAAAITVVGLSGPAIERRDTLSYRNLDGVLFLVDVSASVTEDPRWTQLQTLGRFGIAALGTRPGGLIAFGGDAYVATDMTADHLQLGQTFSLLDGETVPDEGSRPERALALAVALLAQAEVVAGDVVLFTDGEGLGPASLREAEAIAAAGARLSLVALNAPTPKFATHAALGAGEVFTTGQSEPLTAWLAEDARTRLEQQDYPLLFWKDLGRYVLILALLPMLLLFRRQTA